ncbi:hypothetical protein [Streptomyces sp. NBC_01481]|uniref:hypothetical protein n=1 Tax=Streptomyces sp. NBC_01481 TaxID=2975869 RepID=UPI00225994C2|nr:hypothetical protein [Streptomyces sp. NBC_01481]MCX4586922.1 hypothetical protein [Streptomyces sp. NBC_01481]
MLVEMSPERFGVVFQVAKELPNVSDQVIESQDCTRTDASDLLRNLRRARGEIGETTVGVRFRLASGSGEEPVFASSMIEIVAASEDMAKWRRMLEAVCVSLGPEELFLRSGYREEEVREALNSLS